MINLKNIRKAFGHCDVLKGIDLTIHEGEVLALLGPSGTGKTTLLRCINFLERAQDGEVSIDGLTVQCKHPHKKDIISLRRKTAMVFQNYNLFRNKTAIENVMEGLIMVQRFAKPEARRISMEWLEKVGLPEKSDSYPSELSGGQQQRVSIARAMALNPKVILFDEPTSALDTESVCEVLNVIRDISGTGVTMVIVTHEVAFARQVASRLAFMDDGKIIETGTPEEIFLNPKHERTRHFVNKFNENFNYTI